MPTKKEAVTSVVMTFLVVILIYSSVAKFNAFGQYNSYEHCTYTGQYPPVDDLAWSSNCCGYKNTDKSIFGTVTPPVMVCQICKGVGSQKQCFPPHQRVDSTLRPSEPQQPSPNPPSAPPTALFNTSPGANQFNAPITKTTGGSNTSNPNNNNTAVGPPSLAGKLTGNPVISQLGTNTTGNTASPTPSIASGNNNAAKLANTNYWTCGRFKCCSTIPPYECWPRKPRTNTTFNMNPEAGTTPGNNASNSGNSVQQQQQQQLQGGSIGNVNTGQHEQQQQQLQQSTTAVCPDGSQPDANGKCPSSTTSTANNQQQLSLPSSTTPSEQHHHKGKNLSEGGQESTTKKGSNNNDVSSSPPT
ncbi:MAG TPA: hypothetical protein VJ729_00075 [Nitrososphaeraceae archaeon]|nr:hypothetical protein [Nitrososphaeraceae archaeon]